MASSATTAAATATAVAAAVVPTAELVASDHLQQKRWNPIHFTNQNIPAFLRTPYQTAAPPKTFQQKKKKAKEVTSVGGTTAIARTLMMQGLYLFYRTPVKVGCYSGCQDAGILIYTVAVSALTSGLFDHGESADANGRCFLKTILFQIHFHWHDHTCRENQRGKSSEPMQAVT